jgi:tetratricopeptide (TPR) repeat protein
VSAANRIARGITPEVAVCAIALLALGSAVYWATPSAPFIFDDHGNLANLLVSQGNISQALVHYEEVVRLDPGDTGARYHVALALLRLKPEDADAQRALDALKQSRMPSPGP